MKSAARSPIMRLGALVFPDVTNGMTDASATRNPGTYELAVTRWQRARSLVRRLL